MKYLLILASVIMFFWLFENISRANTARVRMDSANDEFLALTSKNKDLQNELNVSDNSQYKEKEARDKLGLAMPGETVFVLPSPNIVRKLAPERETLTVSLPDPNWKKWLKLFI